MIASKPQIFLSRRAIDHVGNSSSGSDGFVTSVNKVTSLCTQPVSRKYVWLETLSRRRFAKRDKQSTTTSDPFDKDPSACMRSNIRSKAFSNATSFCNSDDDGVSAMRRSRASTWNHQSFLLLSFVSKNFWFLPLRTGSRTSESTATSLEMPNGAVKIHSWDRSGRAADIADINCRE